LQIKLFILTVVFETMKHLHIHWTHYCVRQVCSTSSMSSIRSVSVTKLHT